MRSRVDACQWGDSSITITTTTSTTTTIAIVAIPNQRRCHRRASQKAAQRKLERIIRALWGWLAELCLHVSSPFGSRASRRERIQNPVACAPAAAAADTPPQTNGTRRRVSISREHQVCAAAVHQTIMHRVVVVVVSVVSVVRPLT